LALKRTQNPGIHNYAAISNTNARQIPKNSVNHRPTPHPAKTKADSSRDSYYCWFGFSPSRWEKTIIKYVSAWLNI